MDRHHGKGLASTVREPEVLIIKVVRRRRIGLLISNGLMALLLAIPTVLWFWLDSSTGTGAVEVSFLEQIGDLLKGAIALLQLALGLGLLGYALKNIWWGDRLTLSGEGLRYRLGNQVGFVSWHDIKQFRLEAPLLGMAEVVGWDYLDDQAENPSQWKRLRTAGRHATSLHGDLGHRWQGGSCQVRDILEDWRLRHVGNGRPVAARAAASFDPFAGPLTICSSTWKYVLPILLLCSALILGFGISVWLFYQVGSNKPLDCLMFMMPGLMALGILGPYLWLGLRRLIAKPRLILSPEGFELIDERGALFTPWEAVEVFSLLYDAQSHNSYVGWRSKTYRLAHPSSAEMDQSLGAGFVVSPQNLRDMLEDWRIRHSQPRG